jgi:hypothetical protein
VVDAVVAAVPVQPDRVKTKTVKAQAIILVFVLLFSRCHFSGNALIAKPLRLVLSNIIRSE